MRRAGVVPKRTPDVLGKQKRYRQTQQRQADSPMENNISSKVHRPMQVRPAEYLPGDHRSFCTGILRRFHVTTSILRPGHQERERTLLFMESAKPTMFLEPTVAAAARGQVLVRARVAVRRATESMVLIDLVVWLLCCVDWIICALLARRPRARRTPIQNL